MGKVTVSSHEELVRKSNEALAAIHEMHAQAYLAVPSHAWAQQRKLQLESIVPCGVETLTYSQLISNLWEVFGDSRRIIGTLEKRVLLRPLVAQVGLLESSVSPGLVTQLSDFVSEAIYPGLVPACDLTKSESKLMELVSLYEKKLQDAGLIEVAQAEVELFVRAPLFDMHFVFESPDLHSAHIRRFIANLDSISNVTVIEEVLKTGSAPSSMEGELAEAYARLFTGRGDVAATGKVMVGVAHGAAVASDVAAELVERMHHRAHVEYGDMAICCPDPSSAYPRLHESLAARGIPFETRFSLPVSRTGLGAAFCQLEVLSNVEAVELSLLDDDALYEALVDLMCSPYSAVSPVDAQAIQMRWRQQARSAHEKRMEDMACGFNQGNANTRSTAEAFAPVSELLDSSRKDRVHRLFENAKAAHLDMNVLIDDEQAAEVLLDYLEVCEKLMCEPSSDEMANLPVALTRAFGSSENALAITAPNALGLAHAGAVLMTDLDTPHYPMAKEAGPFQEISKKLGIEHADTQARDQRIMLKNTMEACDHAFAFMRSTQDENGAECCQSALFEELVAVYRTPQDDLDGLPVQAVPFALQPWLVSSSEAQAFLDSSKDAVASVVVERGRLADASLIGDLMTDAEGNPLCFSPTALEDYHRCPYRWFTSRRVGFNGMDVAFDAAVQGNLVHAVMARFYEELRRAGQKRVTSENLDQALDIAAMAFDALVQESASRDRNGLYIKRNVDVHVLEDLRKKVFSLVERDAVFLPGFDPTYFELELKGSDAVSLEYAGVPVRGKVDRIDVDSEGNAVIIDYKLSSLSVGYGLSSKSDIPERIQTDIYAVVVQRCLQQQGIDVNVIGSVYRSYAANRLRGAYSNKIDWGPLEVADFKHDALPNEDMRCSYQDYLAMVENAVESRMAALREGVISPAPLSADACQYCKAFLFCPKAGG